jgi:hypothetical protein
VEGEIAAGGRDCLESRVHSNFAKHVPDVVADGLSRKVELFRDLRRRMASFQRRQDFGLTRRQVELRVRDRLLRDVRDLAEDAHDVLAVDEWDRAHFDRHTTTIAVEQDDLGVGDRLVADDLSCECLARAASLLGSNDSACTQKSGSWTTRG